MRTITLNDLERLLKQKKGTCVSIYMPSVVTGKESKQNLIRYGNLLKEARKKLEDAGMSDNELSNYIEPCKKLENFISVWRHPSEGLAVFVTKDSFAFYQLSHKFPECVSVSSEFYVKPLLPIFVENSRFYALALNQSKIAFYEANRYVINEVILENVPRTINEILKFDDDEKHAQSHSETGRPGVGKGSAVFHGQGGIKDVKKKNVLRFFQAVNKGVCAALDGNTDPLILAGLDYEVALYKETNKYPYLLDDYFAKSPSNLAPKEIHRETSKIAQRRFANINEKIKERYGFLEKADRTSEDPARILKAAFEGVLEALLIRENADVWGKFDPETSKSEIHEKRQEGDKDLINLACIHTLKHKGKIYLLAEESFFGKSVLRGITRY